MRHALPVSLGFFVGVVFTIVATIAAKNDDYKVHIESYQMGQKHALRLNPVSWELEETCVALWMGKEDAKAR
jgi:hypothetical protein